MIQMKIRWGDLGAPTKPGTYLPYGGWSQEDDHVAEHRAGCVHAGDLHPSLMTSTMPLLSGQHG